MLENVLNIKKLLQHYRMMTVFCRFSLSLQRFYPAPICCHGFFFILLFGISLFNTDSGLYAEPVIVGASPANEATVVTLPDGRHKIYYINRPGDADRLMSIESADGAEWSKPSVEFRLPGEAYYANRVFVSKDGTVHCVFHIWNTGELGYRGRQLDLWYTRQQPGKNWAVPEKIFEGYVGSIRSFTELQSGRIIFSFGKAVPERVAKPEEGEADFGWNEVISMYSDDAGGQWNYSNALRIQIDSEKTTRYGAVEPDVVELEPGLVWMLIRTNKGFLYESYSHDAGSSWSEPRPSPFISSDSPAAFLRLRDGRLVLFLNMNQRWDDPNSYAFGGREVLHAAISNDNGKTWKGFREVLNVYCAGDAQAKGDRGTAYPSATETSEGEIILVSGQGESRSIVMVDPNWLESENQVKKEDCSTGAKPAPELFFHFAARDKGAIHLNLALPRGLSGLRLGLSDHYTVPGDSLVYENAIVSHTWATHEPALKSSQLGIEWDLKNQHANLYVNGVLVKTLKVQKTSRWGINYLRIQCLDLDGQPVVPADWDFVKNANKNNII